MKRILAIASGKGGVGKTWFSISLAQAMARRNRRVLLIDCDIGLANVDVQLGMTHATDLTHVMMGQISLPKAIRSLDGLGIDVLPGRSGVGYPSGLDTLLVGWLQVELRRLCDEYDVVILDLPSGIEQGVREVMRHADEEIIITTSEPTALTDAYALIKATRHDGLRRIPKIIVNFAEDAEAGRRTLAGMVRVCDRFLKVKPSGLGVIRRDSHVSEAICRQLPLLTCYPGCDAARDVIAAAEAVLAMKVPI